MSYSLSSCLKAAAVEALPAFTSQYYSQSDGTAKADVQGQYTVNSLMFVGINV